MQIANSKNKSKEIHNAEKAFTHLPNDNEHK